jgi:hypothetical protein
MSSAIMEAERDPAAPTKVLDMHTFDVEAHMTPHCVKIILRKASEGPEKAIGAIYLFITAPLKNKLRTRPTPKERKQLLKMKSPSRSLRTKTKPEACVNKLAFRSLQF